MAKIFISYSRVDKDFARQLAIALSDAGADIWLDVKDIPAGMKWHQAIQQGLNSCELMLLVISPDSVASSNVDDEWSNFHSARKPIIPIRWRTAQVHFQLQRLQYVDFQKQSFDAAFAQLGLELQKYEIHLSTTPPSISARLSSRRFSMPLMIGGSILGLVVVIFLLYSPNNGKNPKLTPTTEVADVVTNSVSATANFTDTPIAVTVLSHKSEYININNLRIINEGYGIVSPIPASLYSVSIIVDVYIPPEVFTPYNSFNVGIPSFYIGDEKITGNYVGADISFGSSSPQIGFACPIGQTLTGLDVSIYSLHVIQKFDILINCP